MILHSLGWLVLYRNLQLNVNHKVKWFLIMFGIIPVCIELPDVVQLSG